MKNRSLSSMALRTLDSYLPARRRTYRSAAVPILIGGLAAASVGAAAALLFAPRSGAMTRADLSRRYGQLRERAVKVANGAAESARHHLGKPNSEPRANA